MELSTGLAGALVGATAGALVTFVTAWLQMRRDLRYGYDRELRARRMVAYESLYRKTQSLPRYWPVKPPRSTVERCGEEFHAWYFSEAGGLFLSDRARIAFHDAHEVMAVVFNEGSPQDLLTEAEEERLSRAGQALRRQLAADLGTAEAPRLKGRAPLRTEAPRVRIR